MLWAALTGQRAVLVTDAVSKGESAIAVVAPQAGIPEIGDTVAVRTPTASSFAVGHVAEIKNESMAVTDAFRPDSWTAPVTDLSGSVLAVFHGPAVDFVAGLPPFTVSAAVILLIILLVAIPLHRTEPREAAVTVAPTRHIRNFTDYDDA
ncbi:hypothetical protein D9V28_08850 [Mycetocola zhadangensis]|uniref:Uncharacterized protein n=2 Tax=Mycetocola zhadangensis TaxID=1164595 RepID=A0A3L7J721_9MICO|nr:hypothetical protein D9V28_08850 [Mycetocola zhadangensis]GGE94260.1 hypothetical protein GCM10011313_16530 [Mycetocola zhadangensis]